MQERCVTADARMRRSVRMSDAWIYGERDERTTSRLLAELGFTPHFVATDGSLRPSDADSRAPAFVVVLAAGLKHISCAELCARLAADDVLSEVPLIVALRCDTLADDITAAAGDELLIEPFCADELQARIARARFTVNGIDHDDIIRDGTLELNLATYQVHIDGRAVDFAYMEYELLQFLITHPRRAFSREELLSRVWGQDYYGHVRTVDVHIRRVRAKLGCEHAARIRTVRSVGYRWQRP